MCCAPIEYRKEEIDGECPDCGELTVDGQAYVACFYSPQDCQTCGYAPCDGSC